MRVLILLALVAACFASPDPPRLIPPKNPHDPARLPSDRPPVKVLVAGGGLAGMSAALELAERGYNVTLVERQGFLGGRVATKRKRLKYAQAPYVDPKRYWEVEHGFHAWFHNYHNFKDIFARLNIPLPDKKDKPVQDALPTDQMSMQPTHLHSPSNFSTYRRVHFEFLEKPYKPETVASEGPYPINLLLIILKSRNVNLWDALSTVRALPDMVFYNHKTTVERWQNVTFLEYCRRQKVAPAFFTVFFEPAVSVTLNSLETISAAEMLTFVHLYFISNPQAYHRYVPNQPHSKVLVDPWKRRLQQLGVNIRLNSYVKRLQFDGKGGVRNAEIVVKQRGSDDGDGRLEADDGDEVHNLQQASGEMEQFDQFIMATNLPNQQFILRNSIPASSSDSTASGGQLKRLRDTVCALPIAPRYRVLRVWYSNRINSGDGKDVTNDDVADENEDRRPKIIETPDLAMVNLVILYHRLEDESKQWANQTGGSVLEFHLYTFPDVFADVTDEMTIYRLIVPDVARILPILYTSNVVGLTLGRYKNFPQFDAAVDHIRPTSLFPRAIGVPNLAFAGDWLATPDYPTGLMERAVTTGREAANAILLADGVKQAPLVVTSSHGPGII